MRLKFALLAAIGVTIALIVPASSMAGFHPTNTKFEIKGDSHGPKLTTSLGSCSLAKISGTTPSSETINILLYPTVTPGSCTAGASITVATNWSMEPLGSYDLLLRAGPGAVTLRYASLPGCKLGGGALFAGAWNNSLVVGTPSVYHPESTATMVWSNDGGTCAVAGQKESVRYEDTQTSGAINISAVVPVNNLTSPSAAIWIK